MLNPDLQNEMDMEIQKSAPAVNDFLKGKYFEDTLDLIARVNKLTPEQRESLELECILHILGQNDHNEVANWVLSEVLGGDTEKNKQTGGQIVNDIQEYILNKVPGFKSLSSVQNSFEMGTNTATSSGSLRDQIILERKSSLLSSQPDPDVTGESLYNIHNTDELKTYNQSAPTVKEGDIFHDVYREMAASDDNTPRIG
jgi:hypothetical protein